jgi:hypothetical protein
MRLDRSGALADRRLETCMAVRQLLDMLVDRVP